MNTVSPFRLHILRAMYLLIVVGLGIVLWPSIIDPAHHWQHIIAGQAACMLGAFSLVALIGLRYPLQMLPILLWETIWKTMWLVIVPLPQWLAGTPLSEDMQSSVFACGMVVLVYLAIPWGYVYTQYFALTAQRAGLQAPRAV